KIHLPQLVGVPVDGEKSSGTMWIHRLIADQMLGMWEAWEATERLSLVKTYAGSFVPRYTRGSSLSLSNHAWGTAMDINSEWNQLGCMPARAGTHGSVRELVQIAAD